MIISIFYKMLKKTFETMLSTRIANVNISFQFKFHVPTIIIFLLRIWFDNLLCREN